MFYKAFLVIFFIFFFGNVKVESFNLSPVPNLVLKDPQLKTKIPSSRSSYFGFSIVLRQKSVLIGAPRAQSTVPAQAAVNETGAIYKCSISQKTGDPYCRPFVFDDEGNVESVYGEFTIKDHQWLGAAMDGGPKDDDSLVVCAPRSGLNVRQRLQKMQGVCYWSMNTLYDKPQKASNWIIKLAESGLPYWYSQQGFSVQQVSEGKYLIGAPGQDLWAGGVIWVNLTSQEYLLTTSKNWSLNEYTGYAVASSDFNRANPEQTVFVVTKPHWDQDKQLGQALVLGYVWDYVRGSGMYKRRIALQGTQYGEFFGYAALVEDINGDGLFDILITAPQYTLEGGMEVGAVHVFIAAGNHVYERQLIVSPLGPEGRFGTTITKLGDINLDGFKDIAIGAPFANGSGAVAVYLGSPNGLSTEPDQILKLKAAPSMISSPSTNSMFGHGLSKGVDVDGNGYNDLAIGAPNAESVFVHKAYPVVAIEADIKSTTPAVKLNAQELGIVVCFGMHTNSTKIKAVSLLLRLKFDSKYQRITLAQDGSHQVELNVVATATRECRTFEALLKFLPRHVFALMDLELTYELVNDGIVERSFCEDCVVIDPKISRVARDAVIYLHGCNKSVCEVDLRVTGLEVLTNFTLGSSDIITAKYTTENLGEKAFDAQITISSSLDLPYGKVPSHCVEHFGERRHLVCGLAQGQAFTGSTVMEVAFDVSNLTDAEEVTLSAAVWSIGEEKRAEDNKVNSIIELQKVADVEVLGQSNVNFLTLTKTHSNIEVFYSFKIQNHGPSTINFLQLWLTLPVGYESLAKNQTIEFINITSISLDILTDNYIIQPSNFSLKHLPFQSQQLHRYITDFSLPTERTIVLDCSDFNEVSCAAALFELPHFKAQQNLTLQLRYEFLANSAEQLMMETIDYLGIVPNVLINTTNEISSSFSVTRIVEPTIIVYLKTPETPIWIYIPAAFGGFLILTLLILAFIKLGFFKRQNREEMEKLVNERVEVDRMKSEIEKQTATEL